MKVLRLAAVAAICALLTSACIIRPVGSGTAGGVEEDGGAGVVVELQGIPAELAARPDLSTLSSAITAAGLQETLGATGPLTLFAPTDEAFAALPAGVLDALLLPENKETLTKVLTYHVLDGENPSYAMIDGDLPTLEGQSVTVTVPGEVMVNDSMITEYDVYASNGLIHVVDGVLIPPDVDVAELTGQ